MGRPRLGRTKNYCWGKWSAEFFENSKPLSHGRPVRKSQPYRESPTSSSPGLVFITPLCVLQVWVSLVAQHPGPGSNTTGSDFLSPVKKCELVPRSLSLCLGPEILHQTVPSPLSCVLTHSHVAGRICRPRRGVSPSYLGCP